MKTLTLNVLERFKLLDTFPKEGDLVSQTIIRDIRKKIEVTQNEITSGNFRTEGNHILWDRDKVADLVVQFTDAEADMIKGLVKTEIVDAKKVTQEIIELCLKVESL